MTSVLTPWGVDERGEQVYRAVLRYPGRRVDDLAAMLGWAPQEVVDALRSLLRTRLVRDTDDGLVAANPEAAIEGLLAREEHRISQLRERVADARRAISVFGDEHRAGAQERFSPVPLEIVAGDEVAAVVEDLTRTTTGEIMVQQPYVPHGLGGRPGLRDVTLAQLGRGRAMRAVYPMMVLDHEDLLEYVRFWEDAGERPRLSWDVPARVFVFGQEAALMPAEWGSGTAGSDLVVRTPALVSALRAYLDCVWENALPLPRRHASGGEHERSQLLQLLAMGMKDEALARHLGMSLRTVRRRVATLLADLGVSTRFQAGLEAVRRGWL
ncbi:MAG: helix-turn-helix transcriptional regulator [Actinomycetes bacterium]